MSYFCMTLNHTKSTLVAASFLELGILPIQFETEKCQLLFLKGLLEKDVDDPVHQLYQNMLKYHYESNWANCVFKLREKYNLPLYDQNIISMSKP